jgi:IclR family pca regulon transcriptional regulator
VGILSALRTFIRFTNEELQTTAPVNKFSLTAIFCNRPGLHSSVRYANISAMEKSSDQFVQSFARGLAVIQSFGPNSTKMSITEIAVRTNQSRAGARRILCTLQNLGFVRANGRRFSLTPRILNLGYSYLSSLPFWNFAQPIMESMVAKVHETSSMAVLDGLDIV